MPACESCDERETLLFTCEHCGEQFCLDHQFPHHACARFSSGGATGATDGAAAGSTVAGSTVGGSTSDGSTAEARTATVAASGSTTESATAASTADSSPGPDPSTRSTSTTATPSAAAESTAASAPSVSSDRSGAGAAPVARDAARKTRPDRAERNPDPPGRGMPWERAGETPIDWMQKQSLPGFVLKVGGLSLLFNLAYFGGLAAVVYGWL